MPEKKLQYIYLNTIKFCQNKQEIQHKKAHLRGQLIHKSAALNTARDAIVSAISSS